MKAIVTEFRLIQSLHNREDYIFVARIELPETPDKGEVVNINGQPYVVYNKGWAFSDESTKHYCYIDLLRGE